MTSMPLPRSRGLERIWFLTWTTYGTWLPGDDRGFVSPKFESESPERRNNSIGTSYDRNRPELKALTQSKLQSEPVYLDYDQAVAVQKQFEETAVYRGWWILSGAIMVNHVHLIVGVKADIDPSLFLRDFKSYASRTLNRQSGKGVSKRWWTEQGSKRKVRDENHLRGVMEYVAKQHNPLIYWNNQGEDWKARI